MTDRVDLSPLQVHADATQMLLLARGQLNRAFRAHGLLPPDPLPVRASSGLDVAAIDDPAALGLAQARARFPVAFATWEATMPLKLVDPVLGILRQTHTALRAQPGGSGAAGGAVQKAYEFLLACTQSGEGRHGHA